MANRSLSYWSVGTVLALSVAACSPASPIAPDPGEVNIPGMPTNTGDGSLFPSDSPSLTPTPRPSRTPLPGATPTPWVTPWATPTPMITAYPTPIPTPYPTPKPTPRPTPTPTPVVTASPAVYDLDAFVAALAAKNVTLTDAQLESIRQCVTVSPSGEWGTKGDMTSDETLDDDFSRYKLRFSPTYTKREAYRTAAVSFADGSAGAFYLDLQFFQKYEQPLVAKWDEKTRRFLVITSDGAISTYTAVASLAPARYIPIPANL